MKNTLAYGVALLCVFGLPGLSQAQAPQSTRPWVSAYYLSGDAGSGRLPPTAIDFTAITHLIHFCVFPNADGTLGPVRGVMSASESKTVLTLAHAAGCKVIVSLGTDEGAKKLRAALADPVRPTFVRHLVDFVLARGYDGLDLDIEPLDDSDVPAYSKFVPEVRAALNTAKPGLLLTAAVASQPQMFARLQTQFDQINLMTYDFSGPWPGHKTWYNANLYDAGAEMMNAKEPYPSVDGMVKEYRDAGISAAKLGIGMTFGGYVWSRVSGPKQSVQGLTDKDIDDGADYSTIMDQYYRPERYHWDDQAKAPYLSLDAPASKDRKFVSYDDDKLCALKIAYVKQQHLGGVIIWELGGGYRAHQPIGQKDLLLQAVKKAAQTPVPTVGAESRPWVSAYYLAGDVDNGRLPPSQIDFSAFSHLIVAGISVRADGTIDPLKCGITPSESQKVVAAAHAAGVKVLVLVGGDTGGSIVPSALSAAHRATLARSLVQFAVSNGYDGIDIDFEPIDDANVPDFEKFIPELRANMIAVKPGLLLTAAVATEPAMFARLQVQFDQINLMTYDLSGPWPGFKSWYNAALYDGGTQKMNATDPYPSADGMVAQYTSAGVPKSKLGIGLAFYGYVWSRVTRPQQDIHGLTDKDVNDSVDYDVIMDQYYRPERYHWDDQAKAPYLSLDAPAPKDRKFISYDDDKLCALKIAYVKQQHLGGVIIWQISGGYRAKQPAGQKDALLQAVKKAWLTP